MTVVTYPETLCEEERDFLLQYPEDLAPAHEEALADRHLDPPVEGDWSPESAWTGDAVCQDCNELFVECVCTGGIPASDC